MISFMSNSSKYNLIYSYRKPVPRYESLVEKLGGKDYGRTGENFCLSWICSLYWFVVVSKIEDK